MNPDAPAADHPADPGVQRQRPGGRDLRGRRRAGLAGFTAHLSDVFGTVGVDYYGNALCTKYMHTGRPQLFTDAQRPNNPIALTTPVSRSSTLVLDG